MDQELHPTELVPIPTFSASHLDETQESHASGESARNAIVNGTLDMQEALFEHASRYRSRLKGLNGVISNLHGKIFNEEFINELDPRSLIKIYILARESEDSAVEYLERLHKVVQDSQKVIKVTQTLSMSGVSSGGASPLLGLDNTEVDRDKVNQIRDILMNVITQK